MPGGSGKAPVARFPAELGAFQPRTGGAPAMIPDAYELKRIDSDYFAEE